MESQPSEDYVSQLSQQMAERDLAAAAEAEKHHELVETPKGEEPGSAHLDPKMGSRGPVRRQTSHESTALAFAR